MSTATVVDVSTRKYRSLNPATDELMHQYPTLSDEEAEAALARAHEAYQTWHRTSVEERVALFRRFTEVVEARKDELAILSTQEMGKTIGMSQMEVGLVLDVFNYFIVEGPAMLEPTVTEVPGMSRVSTRREPVGVTLGIEPWNVPLYQAIRAAAPNLMLGNTVVLKPSEITPGSTLLLDEIFREAGFPEGVYQTVLISTDQASSYIADPRVRAVTLTGSDRAGSAVGEQASRHIKPVVLELGGSDGFLVLDNADVSKAVANLSTCRSLLSGQACVSPKRAIVTDAVADEFIPAFVEAFGNHTVGDPFDPETTMGPLSSSVAAEGLQAQVQDAIDKGATVLLEGGRVDGPGAYFKPVVLTDLTPDMRLYGEEAFGPVSLIYRVADADEAVELANSSIYGLGGTVFSEDVEEATRVAERLDTGVVGINSWFQPPANIPFGGTKRSGVGRELGPQAMDGFANLKTYGTV